LWKVDDAATKDLMVDYYRQIRSGVGRTEALRDVQLKMLRSNQLSNVKSRRGTAVIAETVNVPKRRSHPYYWAGFIQSGDWRPVTR
jgi:CHAT domain-containing protein